MSAFQEGVEGLNLFLHLKHMQKAITVTVEINSEFQASLKHSSWHTKVAGSIPHMKMGHGGKTRR